MQQETRNNTPQSPPKSSKVSPMYETQNLMNAIPAARVRLTPLSRIEKLPTNSIRKDPDLQHRNHDSYENLRLELSVVVGASRGEMGENGLSTERPSCWAL